MNKGRRQELYTIANSLLALKRTDNRDVEVDLEPAKNALDMILYEEESYMDSIPESMHNKYEKAEEACDNIENAIDALNDGDIDNAISYIYGATV